MAAPASSTVTYEKRDRVAWLGLNRPEAMNALNPEISAAIGEAAMDAEQDDDVQLMVLFGEGGRAFCAGMDLKWRSEQDASGGTDMGAGSGPGLGSAFEVVGMFPKPVIAAIDGYCLAGGMQLSNRCDIRIATEQSKFGMPEARRALAAVGVADTPELYAPAGEAAWILLTGGHMEASRAYDIGLIQALVPDRDALFAEAERLAGEIKQCAPLALRAIKETLRTKRDMPAPPAGVTELAHLAGLVKDVKDRNANSEDRMEGPKAFAEKRAAVWKNR